MPGKSVVALARVRASVRDAVREALERAGFADAIPRGAPVAVKPNLGWDLFIPGSVTSPEVLDAVLEAVAERTRRLWVVESGQVLESVEKVRRRMGLDAMFSRHGATWVDLAHARRKSVPVIASRVFRAIAVPEPLDQALLLTVPVMKTHDKTLLSGAIKNQWGCIPEFRHNFHLVLDGALVDLLRVLTPRFAVLDGTVALEGDGPKSGWPKVMDLVAASPDAVALDWVQGQLMGFAEGEVKHVALAAEAGLGNTGRGQIEIRGESIEALSAPFRRPRSNLVSRVELGLRRSALRRLAFDTPIFQVLLAGAKAWYHAWYLLGGGRRRAAPILEHALYGRQWRGMFR